MTEPTFFERMRWLFFTVAMKLVGIASLLMGLLLICVCIYGLVSDGEKSLKLLATLGIPSLLMTVCAIKLLRLNFSIEGINKWYSK